MKISVVVPSYNQGQFLEECLTSILDQDWPDTEVIVMDGGSIDDSVEIIKKYEKHLAYWQSQRDGGQTPAINAGFAKATGRIAGWLNSDDAYRNGALARAALAFDSDPELVIVQGRMDVMEQASGRLTQRRNPGIIGFSRILNGKFSLNQPGSFFRKNAMDKVGPLDEALNYVMDYEYWLRLSREGSIKELDEAQAMHRLHEDCKTMGDFAKTFVPEIRRIRKRYGGSLLCRKQLDLTRIEFGSWRRKLLARSNGPAA